MKKITLAAAILLSIAAAAQPVSKKGEPFLPEAGDWAVGIDAVPFLDYFGNFFNQNGNSAPTAEFTNSNFAITGKYFKSADLAYRASARFGILADNQKAFVPEFSTTPTNTTVEDKYSRNFNNLYVSLGLEKRKGNTRIQGFYGAEAGIGFGTEKHTFEYGNGITPQNTSPVRSEFVLEFQNDPTEITNVDELGAYMTEYKKGTTFRLGARAFVGAEIFLFPKWSLGFEYGFGMGYSYTGNSTIIAEQWTVPVGGSTEQFVTTVTDQGGTSAFRIDNDNTGGSLFMFFYF
jgi:hypothetical protein